jgi:hypothetical protein
MALVELVGKLLKLVLPGSEAGTRTTPLPAATRKEMQHCNSVLCLHCRIIHARYYIHLYFASLLHAAHLYPETQVGHDICHKGAALR